jgi:hypothetical protein
MKRGHKVTVCESNAAGPEWGESWYVLVEDVVCMVNGLHIFCGRYIDELERHRESRKGEKKNTMPSGTRKS